MGNGLSLLGLIKLEQSADDEDNRNNEYSDDGDCAPDDGLEKYTVGYEILTKPEDILDLSDADRDARKSAAIRIRIFRAGAIHSVPVDISVY